MRSGKHTRVVTIARADITVPVASSEMLNYHGKKIGYVQLTSFAAGSGAEVRAQVQKVLHQGAQALILDLRENGGGLLEEAVNVASIFIPDGTIVSTKGRASRARSTWPRATRSRPRSRWWCSSTAGRRRRRRS